MKIAIQGLEASFHALASQKLFGKSVEFVYCNTFSDVFDALEGNKAQGALVAIENSLYGSINEVYDLLLKHEFYITAEVYQHIGLQLMGPRGSLLEEISDVYSQAPALAEAAQFLNEQLPSAELHEHQDTALAAKEVAQWSDRSKAAIASSAAAQLYDLQLLAENIETHQQNYTRFIALSKQRKEIHDANKISITFQTADTPGSLYNALGVFAKYHANLTKIESRPIIGSAWQYMYYVDFVYPNTSELIVGSLAKFAFNIKVLGSYKSGA